MENADQEDNSTQSATSSVADFALQLHKEGASSLRLELRPEQMPAAEDLPAGCSLISGAIEFESIELRNEFIALTAHDNYLSSSTTSEYLFKHAYELWRHEIGHNDKASGRFLALASANIDVLALGAKRIIAGENVFNILNLIEAALPYLKTLNVQSIVDLIEAKYDPTKNDLAAGLINGALEHWLERQPEIAYELHKKTLENLNEATSSLLGNATIAISKSDYSAAIAISTDDLQSGILMQMQVAAWSLGRLLLDENPTPTEINIVSDIVIKHIASEIPEVRSEAIKAAVGAIHKTAVFDEILQELAESADQEVLCAAANALFFKSKEIQARGITQHWLQLLPALKPEFAGAIKHLDWAISKLLPDHEYTDIALSTLSQWITSNNRPRTKDYKITELFDDTIRVLISLEEPFSQLLTDWLMSDRPELVVGLEEILLQISTGAEKTLRFEKSRLDQLSESELLFLARRMLGFIYDQDQLTSLALSMLQSNDVEKRIYPLLGELLVNEIGYDYPGSTADALFKTADETSSKSHQAFLRAAAEEINRTLEQQMALPTINELKPPSSLRRLFNRARAKQMANSREEADKDSFWRQIATEIPIKAGMRTFSYRDSSYGASMELSSISHSFELPRREVFDPIGNSLRRIGFRIAKRDEE